MIALLYCLYIANAAGAFAHLTWITRWVDIGSMLGSHAAITVSGVLLGMILTADSPIRTHVGRLRWALLYGLALATAGYLLHTAHDVHRMFIINKIFATPPWCLWSSAITIWVWVAIYWLMDMQRWTRWARVLEPAGQNPLFAYILAPILYALFALVAMALGRPNFYEMLGNSFAVGFWRSIVFAFIVTWLAAGLRRAGLQVKL
jgi:predicted acyltransferase